MNPTLQPISVEREIGGRTLTIETGRIARQAHGSVTVRMGDTIVFVAVTTGDPRPGLDFFPLTVDYREVMAAIGKIPGGFFKREGRPSTGEILTCRLIDRPVRPMFPKGFKDDVLIQARVFSADGEIAPDVLALIGASTALSISKLPFEGPIGGVRLGRVGDEFIVFPTNDERKNGDLDLVVAGTNDAITMVECGARELGEDLMAEALFAGHEIVREICGMITELSEKVGAVTMDYTPPAKDEEALGIIDGHIDRIRELNFTAGKHQRKVAMRAARGEILEAELAKAKLDSPDEQKSFTRRLKAAWEVTCKRVVREAIINEGKRADGRGVEDIRDIHIETGVYPRTHGSTIFTRGETQAVVSATLGTIADTQRLGGLNEGETSNFMLHYNFPSYCVGETWPNRGPKRREIGHGALAERSLAYLLPDFAKFPYTVRVVSEITESNGSSSMATVCGGCLAMMDAGVKIRRPVAGIAMGLIKEGDEVRVLSDILGLEDACGDMDFKVAGTQKGITALQMDVKLKGLTKEIMVQALDQAKRGRMHILKIMLEALAAPRPEISAYAPKIHSLPIAKERIGALIGPGGKTIRRIQEENGVKIEIDDEAGLVFVAGTYKSKLDVALKIVRSLAEEVEVGSKYTGRVVTLRDFGAFVEILPGQEGLLPISEVDHSFVENINEFFEIGDSVEVKVIEMDQQGRVRLSRKALLEGGSESSGEGGEGSSGGGRERGGRSGSRDRGRGRGRGRDGDRRRGRSDSKEAPASA